MSQALIFPDDRVGLVVRIVTASLESPHSKRIYARAIRDFLAWYEAQGNPPLSKALIQEYLNSLPTQTAASVNQRLAAIRKMISEGVDNGVFPREILFAVNEIRGRRNSGTRMGIWLTKAEAEALLQAPDTTTLRGVRDQAVLAIFLGAGLRRAELAKLTFEQIVQVEGRWVILNLRGKRGKIRSIPIPSWVKHCIDRWSQASGLSAGVIFRRMDRNDKLIKKSTSLTPQAIRNVVVRYSELLIRVAPHDLRRTFAKLAHKGGAGVDQIQLSLGHSSMATTEKYLGVDQDISDAPCDHLGIQLKKD